MTHPWEDPDLMPLYHVQLETRDLIVSYEVATPNADSVEIAKAHLRERLRDPHIYLHYGGGSNVVDDVPVLLQKCIPVPSQIDQVHY